MTTRMTRIGLPGCVGRRARARRAFCRRCRCRAHGWLLGLPIGCALFGFAFSVIRGSERDSRASSRSKGLMLSELEDGKRCDAPGGAAVASDRWAPLTDAGPPRPGGPLRRASSVGFRTSFSGKPFASRRTDSSSTTRRMLTTSWRRSCRRSEKLFCSTGLATSCEASYRYRRSITSASATRRTSSARLRSLRTRRLSVDPRCASAAPFSPDPEHQQTIAVCPAGKKVRGGFGLAQLYNDLGFLQVG
jgi:hypothetical protein